MTGHAAGQGSAARAGCPAARGRGGRGAHKLCLLHAPASCHADSATARAACKWLQVGLLAMCLCRLRIYRLLFFCWMAAEALRRYVHTGKYGVSVLTWWCSCMRRQRRGRRQLLVAFGAASHEKACCGGAALVSASAVPRGSGGIACSRATAVVVLL